MTLGFERSLPTPLASAAVIKKSPAKFVERCASSKPLVGAPAARLLTKGITGGVEFTIDHREIGHLHGDRLADLPFPTRIRDELIASGRARPHHVLPESGWVSRWIRGPEDVTDVIALFRLNFERLAKIGQPGNPESSQR